MLRPLFFTLVVAGLLAAVLAAIGDPARWPAPEQPPRQGEALDPAELAFNRAVHASAALGQVVREPQNTWSNLGFVFGGFWLLGARRGRVEAIVAAALIAVGIGSFLYHASASRTLRHLDVGAMYAVLLLMLVVVIRRFWPAVWTWSERRVGSIALVVAVVAVVLTAGRNLRMAGFKPFDLSLAVGAGAGGIVGALVVVAWQTRRRQTTLACAATLGLFAVALICQLGDRPGAWLCAPGALVQGHALWHLLAALSLTRAVSLLRVREGGIAADP